MIRARKNRNVIYNGKTCNIKDVAARYKGNYRMDCIDKSGKKECSKRIYEIPKFTFYALGYALERVLSMSRNGISGFLPKKVKSQQLNLFEHFKIEDSGAYVF